jgi:hypothetical protein
VRQRGDDERASEERRVETKAETISGCMVRHGDSDFFMEMFAGRRAMG